MASFKRNALSCLMIMFSVSLIYGQGFLRKYRAETGRTELNYYEVQKWAQDHFKEIEVNFKAEKDNLQGSKNYMKYGSYLGYKRWEWYWGTHIKEDGSFPISAEITNKIKKEKQRAARRQSRASWTYIGMTNNNVGYWGSGRVGGFGFHPTDPNTFWVGSAIGGVWKTTDGGASYVQQGDDLPYHGASLIAVDPNNPDIVYIAVARHEYYDNDGVGIYKSTDGGNSWSPTGLTNSIDTQRDYFQLIISPTNSNVLFAATRHGLYKTTDAGATWSVARGGVCTDVAFKPGSGTTVYVVSKNNVYRSTDTGSNWEQVSSYGNTSEICVSPANSNFIALNNDGELYTSINQGDSWTYKSTMPNTHTFGVSPNNTNIMYCGFVVIYRSDDGGENWTQKTNWYNNGVHQEVHADLHVVTFHPANPNHLFFGTDGGVCKYLENSDKFTEYNNGLNIAQCYSVAVCEADENVILYGTQDNGGATKLSNSNWRDVYGGDCMETAYDPENPNTMFGTYIEKLYRSYNAGANNVEITPPGKSGGAWVTPYMLDPNNAKNIIAGYKSVWRSTDQGNNWTNIGNNIAGGSDLDQIAMSPANSDVIYVSESGKLYVTTNNGGNWTNSANFSNSITSIAVSSSNTDHLWVTTGGFNAGKKVFKSVNGGYDWTNISGSIPNVPVNCIIYENGSNDDLYVGTRIGIYHINADMGDWESFNQGLPYLDIMDFAIHYGTRKLRAATYGRGVWETSLVSEGTLSALFKAVTATCSGAVQFNDQSSGSPTSWSWDFGDGNTSNQQNPSHTYTSEGTYKVQLIASNGNGNDTYTTTLNVVLANEPKVSGASGCKGETLSLSATGDGTLKWYNAQTGGDLLHTGGTFNTPVLNTTTSYFVENITKNVANVGPADNTIGNGGSHSGLYGQVFDVFENIVVKSIKVFANGAGERTFNVYDAINGNVLLTETVNLPNGESRVKLNLNLKPGKGYFINITSTLVDLYRNTDGVTYPYTVDNLLSITNSNGTNENDTYYYYFYDWEVEGPGCASKRVEVEATINPSPKPTITLEDGSLVTETGFNSYQWYLNGNNIQGATSNTLKPTETGDYNVVVANNNCEGESKTFTFSLSMPEALFIHTNKACTGELVFTDKSTNAPTTWQWDFGDGNSSSKQNPIHTYADPGTYKVVLTAINDHGSDTHTEEITIRLAGESTVRGAMGCVGDVLTLSATGDGTINWYDAKTGGELIHTGGTFTTPALTNTTVYYVENDNGCASGRLEVEATIHKKPTPIVTYGGGELSTEKGFNSYQWYLNGKIIQGGIANKYVPTENGDYTVIVTNSYDCEGESKPYTVAITFLNEESIAKNVNIYPNPSSGVYNLNLSNYFGNVQLSVTDAAGREVYSRKHKNVNDKLTCTIDISDYANGQYFVNIRNGKGVKVHLLIKE